MGISAYSTTPGSNTAISGINLAEGCNASGINDAIRQLMADIATACSTFGQTIMSAASAAAALTALGFSAFMQTLVGAASASAARTTLGITTNLITVTYTISSSAPSGGSAGDLWFRF